MIFIYFELLSLCFCISKACFPISLIICLLLQTKYTLITLEIQIAFIFSLVEQTFVDFPFVFEDLCFTIHLIKKFRIVRVLVCLVNCLKYPYCKIRLTLSCHLFRFTSSVFCLPLLFIYKYASNMISSVFV